MTTIIVVYLNIFDLIALKDYFKSGRVPQNGEDETRKWLLLSFLSSLFEMIIKWAQWFSILFLKKYISYNLLLVLESFTL